MYIFFSSSLQKKLAIREFIFWDIDVYKISSTNISYCISLHKVCTWVLVDSHNVDAPLSTLVSSIP